jgi:hypothetical protein
MLQEALCNPSDGEVYYHYCSALAFQAICDSKAIRFSDASTMNDAAEMVWGRETLTAAGPLLTKLRNTVPILKDLDAEFFMSVSLIFEKGKSHLHPFIAAFSRQPRISCTTIFNAPNGRGHTRPAHCSRRAIRANAAFARCTRRGTCQSLNEGHPVASYKLGRLHQAIELFHEVPTGAFCKTSLKSG